MPGANALNRVKMTTVTTGTGTVTLGEAVSPFQSFSSANAKDQQVYSYLIEDANGAWEVGYGTYSSSGTTFTRTLDQSSTGSLLNLSGIATLSVVERQADFVQLIAETVTASSASSVTFSVIPTTFRDLQVRVRGRSGVSAVVDSVVVQLNGDTAGNYDQMVWQAFGTTVSGASSFAQTSMQLGQLAAATAPANYAGVVEFTIYDYKGTTFDKTIIAHSSVVSGTSGNGTARLSNEGNWRSTSAVTSVKVFLGTGPFVDGSVVSLYGLP